MGGSATKQTYGCQGSLLHPAILIESNEIHGPDLRKAEQLRDAAVLIQKSIALDLAKVKSLIADGNVHEASPDLPQLKGVMPEGDAQLAALEAELNKPELKDALKADKERYEAAIKALKLELVEPKQQEDGLEWKSLVTREDFKTKGEKVPATVWRMKIVEAFPTAPNGWAENNFDDSDWTEVTMLISWRTNHTALFRAPFAIADKSKVKALRLRQWAFHQEDMQVFING